MTGGRQRELRAIPPAALNIATGVFGGLIYLCAVDAVPSDQVALHAKNFAFSGTGMLLLARSSWRRGFTRRWLWSQAALYGAVNLVVELAVDVDDVRLGAFAFTDVNTADPVDALYGLAAVATVLVLALTTARPSGSRDQRGGGGGPGPDVPWSKRRWNSAVAALSSRRYVGSRSRG